MKISLSTYLKEILERGLHLSRSWRFQAYAIKETYLTDPYYPIATPSGVGFHNDEGELVELEGIAKVPKLTPILPQYTPVTMKADDMLILDKDTDSTIGGVIINHMAFTDFHPRYPFIQGTLNKKSITEPFLIDILAGNNDPEYNATFLKAISDISTLFAVDSEFLLRSVTIGMFDHDKDHDKLKKRLIEENKGNLKDPLVIAKIEGELAKSTKARYDKIGVTLWKGGKTHNVTLMKTEGLYGSETNVDGKPSEYIIKSLKEGVELDKMGVHVGVARYGSVGRGKLTALGGAAVNDSYRALQSRTCDSDDCGTKRGIPKRIRSHNYELYVGQALRGGKAFLSEAQLKIYIGTTIYIRAPSSCEAGPNKCCKVCGGKDISRIPDSIPTKATGFMSTLMDLAMQATHGIASLVTEVDFEDDIY